MTNKTETKKAAKNAYKWLIEATEGYYGAKTERSKKGWAYEIEHHLQVLTLTRNALAAK